MSATKVAGVVGWPVAHSLSPLLHSFWLREYAVDGAYVPLAVKPAEFSDAIRGLMAAGLVGVNVTVPHKQAAFALAHQWDETAQRAGAANLLLFSGGRIEARNTDVAGLASSLIETLGPIEGKTVLILGAGGAARAAILACVLLKVRQIDLLNRTERSARALGESLSSVIPGTVTTGGLDSFAERAPFADVVINATSAGLSGSASPQIALEHLPPNAAVCDLVYSPLETPLLAQARAAGLKTIDGLGMLMHQAVPTFEAFYGVRPLVTSALRAKLEEALRR